MFCFNFLQIGQQCLHAVGFNLTCLMWASNFHVTVCLGHRLAVLPNGALKFSRVTLGDAGTYQCLAKNEAGVAVGRTKLVLQGNADFLSHHGNNIM